jgi:hypothetical protein
MFRSAALIIALTISTVQCQAAEPVMAQPFALRVARYPAWGFELQVPRASVTHSLPVSNDVLLFEMYVYGDFVYFVKTTKTPPNTLASTAIEQTIQAMTKASSTLGPYGRWEIDSKRKDLFKGLSRATSLDDASEAEKTLLRKALRGREAFQSLCMAPLGGDEAEVILTIGVIGPKSRANEIENIVKFMAYNVTAVSTQTIQSDKISTARNAIATAVRILKKGEIELVGIVESIDPDNKTMTMLVDQITMPGLKPITLSPARRKLVYYSKLPDGLESQTRLSIVGKNTGVGKPMKADLIRILQSE